MNETHIVEREMDPLDALVLADYDTLADEIAPASLPMPHRAPPAKVDLGQYLHYIRKQGGAGCFAYALLAVWDIMNEMACPYTPNLAVAPWMFFHRRRDIWEKLGGVVTRDGRFISWKTGPEFGFFQVFGNPTEGTEMAGYSANPWCGLTNLDIGPFTLKKQPAIGWTVEGINESHEYRLAGWPQPLPKVNSEALMLQLAAGRPMRVQIPGHFVVLVGYDYFAKTFTFVDSAGDQRHNGGFGTYSFAQIDDPQNPIISKAEVINIVPPRPVPAARIWFTHTNRMNVALWLSIEGSPIPKRQIWPPPQFHDDCVESRVQGRWFPWDDSSNNLHYTVRLPSEMMWPPGKGERLVLDLHDSAAVTNTGGHLVEFTAAFGGHVMKCDTLAGGPVQFEPHTHQRFFIG
jgi:hypothetical protein